MDYFAAILTEFVGDPELANWLVVLIIGFACLLFIVAFMFLISGIFSPFRRRLRAIQGIKKTVIKKDNNVGLSIGNISPVFLPKDAKEVSKIRSKLIQAGFREKSATSIFFATKTIAAIALPAVVVVAAPFIPGIGLKDIIIYAMISTGIGVFGPNIVLEKLLAKRQKKIRQGFPDALDLLVVCVEAGLGFDIAIRRIAREMQHSHPVIAEEFGIVSAEIGAGVDRIGALKSFADRTGLTDIQGFVALLSQSIRFGTSIGDTLRIYSEDFRDKRMQKAEEMAAKVSTKMIFPMVLCFFPSFFVVAGGPIILRVMDVLK